MTRSKFTYVLSGVADRDPGEVVLMFFATPADRREFEKDLPGTYLHGRMADVDFDTLVVDIGR